MSKVSTCSITCPDCGFKSNGQKIPHGKTWTCGYCGSKIEVETLNEENAVKTASGEEAPALPTPPSVKPPEVPQ